MQQVVSKRKHFVGTCKFTDDAQARVYDNGDVQFRHRTDEPWKDLGKLPYGTFVHGYGRLRHLSQRMDCAPKLILLERLAEVAHNDLRTRVGIVSALGRLVRVTGGYNDGRGYADDLGDLEKSVAPWDEFGLWREVSVEFFQNFFFSGSNLADELLRQRIEAFGREAVDAALGLPAVEAKAA